jgi:hypothetical protein
MFIMVKSLSIFYVIENTKYIQMYSVEVYTFIYSKIREFCKLLSTFYIYRSTFIISFCKQISTNTKVTYF